MSTIFLNYRREDSGGYALSLFDRLANHFGREAIFKDIDSIPHGASFSSEIEKAVVSCDIFLVVIGRTWLSISDQGRCRLDDPEDFVRLEIIWALSRERYVIPILVGGAIMPSADVLPQPLKPLAAKQAITLNDVSFQSDADRLFRTIKAKGVHPEEPLRIGKRIRAQLQHSEDLTRVIQLDIDGELHVVKFQFKHWAINKPLYYIWVDQKQEFAGYDKDTYDKDEYGLAIDSSDDRFLNFRILGDTTHYATVRWHMTDRGFGFLAGYFDYFALIVGNDTVYSDRR
jgi:TIR domain